MKKNNALGTKLLMLAVTLALAAYFGVQGYLYFTDPLSTTLAYNYQVEESVSLSGYVARTERVLEDDASGLLRLQRSEGERVSRGGTVAAVYADQASLDRQAEIDALTTRIEQLEYAQEAALGSEVSLKLDAQIMQSILDYQSSLAEDRLVKAEEHGGKLRNLVLKRDYTYSETEDLSGQITELRTQLKEVRARAAGSVRYITAPAAGLYSAVVDGYETVLTPESLEDMTPSRLTAVRADSGVRSSVGKLILGDTWYYAAVMSAGEAEELRGERRQPDPALYQKRGAGSAGGAGLCGAGGKRPRGGGVPGGDVSFPADAAAPAERPGDLPHGGGHPGAQGGTADRHQHGGERGRHPGDHPGHRRLLRGGHGGPLQAGGGGLHRGQFRAGAVRSAGGPGESAAATRRRGHHFGQRAV